MTRIQLRITEFTARNFLGLSLFFWVVGISPSVAVAIKYKSLESLLKWKLDQYYVSYLDLGFIKRGLVGTLMHPLFGAIGDKKILAITAIAIIDLIVIFGGLRALKKLLQHTCFSNSLSRSVILVLVVFSPVGVMQLGFDVGRFDHINMLIAGYSLMLLNRGKYFLSGLLVGLGVLTHEAMTVFALPVFLSAIFCSKKHGSLAAINISLLRFSVIPIACSMAVLGLGNTEADLKALLPFGVGGGQEVWSRGLIQVASELSFIQYAIVAFYAITPSFLIWCIYKKNELPLDLMFFSPMLSFSLFAFGIDYARWCQLIFFANLMAVSFHLAKRELIFRDSSLLSRSIFFLYILPLGPIGVTIPLPYIEFIFDLFSPQGAQ